MLSTQNLFSPASGVPIVAPIQDIVLGLYYLTEERPGARGEGATFGSPEEATLAYDTGEVDLSARVKCRVTKEGEDGTPARVMLEATPGQLDRVFPGSDHAVYLHGSRAEGSSAKT